MAVEEIKNPETGAGELLTVVKFFAITVGVFYLGKLLRISPAVKAWEEGMYTPFAIGPAEISFGPLPVPIPRIGTVNIPLGRFIFGALFTGAWYVLGGAGPLGSHDEITSQDINAEYAKTARRVFERFKGRAVVAVTSQTRRIQVYLAPAWARDP